MTTTAPTGIKCGNCKEYHVNVAAVRQCFQLGDKPLAVVVNRPAAPLPKSGPLATARQLSVLREMCEERDTTLEHEADVTTLTIAGATQLFSELKARPRTDKVAPTTTAATPEVPAGRYAIEVGGTVKFYKVDRPTEGRWMGRTFIKVQAGGNFHTFSGPAAKKVLEAIAKDPREASIRYGRELEHCGVCGISLTNPESRANGIGPICAGKMGW